MTSVFREYMDYVGLNESPDIYHRWVLVSAIASQLSRNCWFQLGPFTIYPNMYILLQGLPAVRKSSAISIGHALLRKAGYKKFASDRMSREQFLIELHSLNQPDVTQDLDALLSLEADPPSEITVHAGEFLDFIGQNDKDYLMLITNLWDNRPEYRNPKASSRHVNVIKPTINLLGGVTPENLHMAFPPEVLGTGTLSRFIFIHSYGSGRKVFIPTMPDAEKEKKLVEKLKAIRELSGPMTLSTNGYEALEYIYNNFKELEDPRFQHYSSRRQDHLLKLCMICAAGRLSLEITEEDVILANTMLAAAEYSMPKALGHFGRSRNSVVYHSIIEYIETRGGVVTPKEIYSKFANDFNKESEFLAMLWDMANADKIKNIREDDKYLGVVAISSSFPKWAQPLMQLDELTAQERGVIGL